MSEPSPHTTPIGERIARVEQMLVHQSAQLASIVENTGTIPVLMERMGALDIRLKKLEDAPGTEGLAGKVEENTADIDKLKDAAIEVAAYKKLAMWLIGLGGTGGAAAAAAALSKFFGDPTAP